MPAVRTYDDMTKVGAEVKAKGFTAPQDQHRASRSTARSIAYRPGFVVGQRLPGAQLGRLHRPQRGQDRRGFPRRAAGPMSASCSTPTSTSAPKGFRRIAEAVGPAQLDLARSSTRTIPKSIALIRRDRAVPDRLGRDAAGAPRLPALLRGLCLRHRHRRRDLERLLRDR